MTQNGPITSPEAHSRSPIQSKGIDGHPLRELCRQIHERLAAFLAKDFTEEVFQNTQKQCRHSLNIIHEALDRYPFPTLSLSYNGGKDCLVLLILYLSALFPSSNSKTQPPALLPSIYIPPPNPFPAQEAFVTTSSNQYHLALSRHAHPSMKAAFATYLSSPAGAQIKAIFVGTRRTDPHGANLTAFDITDHGWPSFMRVHPVLEWRYAEVWAFLRQMGVEYCGLYDEGFTSLGGREDTKPNPVLAVRGPEGKVVGFRPAYELVEDKEERLGREK